MGKQEKKNISVRIDIEAYKKLCMIAKGDSRSVSGQVCYWLRQCIREYEQTHGECLPQKNP